MSSVMKEKPEPLWPLLLVVAVIGVAVFVFSMSVDWWGNTVYRSALVTAVILMVVADIQILRHHRRKKTAQVPKSDERLDRIFVYASAYSWRLSIVFMIVLIILELLKVLTLDTVVALSASVMMMAGTFFVVYTYFDRKGDVE